MRIRTAAPAGLLAAVVLAGMAAAPIPVAGADDKIDRAKAAKRAADAGTKDARAELAESSARLARAEAAYALLERRIPAAKAELARTNGDLRAARAADAEEAVRLKAAEHAQRLASQRLAATTARLDDQQAQVGRFVQLAYQRGSIPIWSMAIASGNFEDIANGMIYLDQISAAQNAALSRIRAERAQLATDAKALELRRLEVEAARERAAAQLVRTEQLAAQAEAAQRQVAALLKQQADVVRDARRERAADEARYQEMRAESDRLEQVIAAEMRRTRNSGSSRSSEPANLGGRLLSAPASGRVSSPYGMRFHPILRYRKLHTGVDMALPSGTKVGAARAGRVLESYYNSAYGNRIVITHGYVNGVHLTTTYNHLSQRWVAAGERIQRGQTLGLSGSTGWSTGPHLHFEVLVNGRFRDPMRWL